VVFMVLIKGLQKTTIVDYPGKVACIVFTGGCNLRCPFCQNPDLIEKERYEGLETISESDFFDFLERRRKWIDGVVITGGEPTLQNDLPKFMKAIKERGFLVKLDTNGSNPAMLKTIIEGGLADFIAMDVKASLDNYEKAVGINIGKEKIKESIDIVKEAGRKGIDYEFRTTVVPGIHSKDDIAKMGQLLKGSKKIALQQFSNKNTYDKSFRNIRPFTKEDIIGFKSILEQYIKEVEIRI